MKRNEVARLSPVACSGLLLMLVWTAACGAAGPTLDLADWARFNEIQRDLDQRKQLGYLTSPEQIATFLEGRGREGGASESLQAALRQLAPGEVASRPGSASTSATASPVGSPPTIEDVVPWSEQVAAARRRVAHMGHGELATVLEGDDQPALFAALEVSHLRGWSFPASRLRAALARTSNSRVALSLASALAALGGPEEQQALAIHVARRRPAHLAIRKLLDPEGRQALAPAESREGRLRVLVALASAAGPGDRAGLRAIEALQDFLEAPDVRELLAGLSQDPSSEVAWRARRALFSAERQD